MPSKNIKIFKTFVSAGEFCMNHSLKTTGIITSVLLHRSNVMQMGYNVRFLWEGSKKKSQKTAWRMGPQNWILSVAYSVAKAVSLHRYHEYSLESTLTQLCFTCPTHSPSVPLFSAKVLSVSVYILIFHCWK